MKQKNDNIHPGRINLFWLNATFAEDNHSLKDNKAKLAI